MNIILIKELVTSNEGSLDGKMVRCKFIYKRRRKPRDRFKILMPKVRMLTLREFRHVFLHAEPQFDSEISDVCSKMAGREKCKFETSRTIVQGKSEGVVPQKKAGTPKLNHRAGDERLNPKRGESRTTPKVKGTNRKGSEKRNRKITI